MMYQELYEKLQGAKALDLLNDEVSIKSMETYFPSELLHLTNMTLPAFKLLDIATQITIKSILGFYKNNLETLIDDVNYSEIMGLEVDDEDAEFSINLSSWKESSILAKPSYNELDNLNAIKLWHYNVKEPKYIFERMEGVPIEVIYTKGRFEKAVVAGKDVSKNAVYFNGMVKELDDTMDCIVTGVTTIMYEDIPTVKAIIELEAIGVEPTAEAITSQLKNRNEELFEHITFIADNIHIIKFHHTGENVV